MGYRSLEACVADLRQHDHLLRIEDRVDPHLEAAEIHRRVFAAGGPALYFANVAGTPFPMLSNLFGTKERTRFLFRDTLDQVKKLVELKADPGTIKKAPLQYTWAGLGAWRMLPRRVRRGPVLRHQTTLRQLPALQSWPLDGGPFITLPQVYSEHVDYPGLMKSNLGMYRVQLAGNAYEPDREIGLHYQIHRGIGVHHQAALRAGQPFRVNIFIGGAPAMCVAAVMPLPEGLSELTFAGALAGHRIPMIVRGSEPGIYADADFCITGVVEPERLLPEGPFGDHLGYYSLQHPFPVLRVEKVYHRGAAIWPFTVVGRPPQEDTMFGELIHEITGPMIPKVVPGVSAVHAVDVAGVHPLMLAVGSERYTPFQALKRPSELLTQANAILGQGQMSLAKYLLIVDGGDHDGLDIHDIGAFLDHLLSRIDWSRDLHFQTSTTIDTLDYSGSGMNEGSKVVMAAAGPVIRELATEVGPLRLPDGCERPRMVRPGILAITSPRGGEAADDFLRRFCRHFDRQSPLNRWTLVALVDDSDFVAQSLENFLWVVFTRSNPADDIDGIEAFVAAKHWGCHGSLVIDARRKPHHAPPLEVDPRVAAAVDARAAAGGPLARWL